MRKKSLWMSSLFVIVLGAMIFGTAGPALARRSWCWSDPVYDVDGDEINVVLELAPFEVMYDIPADHPVKVELKAPKGSNPRLVLLYGEFAEEGKAREHAKKDEVHIKVKMPKEAKSYEAMRVSVSKNGVLVGVIETEKREAKIVLRWPDTALYDVCTGDGCADGD